MKNLQKSQNLVTDRFLLTKTEGWSVGLFPKA